MRNDFFDDFDENDVEIPIFQGFENNGQVLKFSAIFKRRFKNAILPKMDIKDESVFDGSTIPEKNRVTRQTTRGIYASRSQTHPSD